MPREPHSPMTTSLWCQPCPYSHSVPMAIPVPMAILVPTASPVVDILQASQDILQAAQHTAWL